MGWILLTHRSKVQFYKFLTFLDLAFFQSVNIIMNIVVIKMEKEYLSCSTRKSTNEMLELEGSNLLPVSMHCAYCECQCVTLRNTDSAKNTF